MKFVALLTALLTIGLSSSPLWADLITYDARGVIKESGRSLLVDGTITFSNVLRHYPTGEEIKEGDLGQPRQLGYFITRYRLEIDGYDYHGYGGSLYFEGPFRKGNIGSEEWFLDDPAGDTEALRSERWLTGFGFWFLDDTGLRLDRDQMLETPKLPPIIILWSHNGIFSSNTAPASHILLRALPQAD